MSMHPAIPTMSLSAAGLVLALLTPVMRGGMPRQDDPAATKPPYLAAQERSEVLRSPGPAHRRLEFLAGLWTLHVRARFDPDEEWEASTAFGEGRSLLGGRFFEMHAFEDPATGKAEPYAEHYVLGHDNARQRFSLQYTNTFSTATMTGDGLARDDGSIVLDGTYDEAMAGRPANFRWTFAPQGPDRFVLNVHMEDEGGTMFHAMEIVHTPRVDASRPHLGRWSGTYTHGEKMTFTFHPGGTAVWTVSRLQLEMTMNLTWKYDACAAPRHLDLSGFTEGPLAGRTMYGIIEFPDLNTFRLDLEPGAPRGEGADVRPTEFTDSTITCSRQIGDDS